MATVILGNVAPIEPVKIDPNSTDVERVLRPDLGNTVTTYIIGGDDSLADALKAITTSYPSHHSDADPAWVESDDSVLAGALAREFDCPVGRPDTWSEGPQDEDEDEE